MTNNNNGNYKEHIFKDLYEEAYELLGKKDDNNNRTNAASTQERKFVQQYVSNKIGEIFARTILTEDEKRMSEAKKKYPNLANMIDMVLVRRRREVEEKVSSHA